MCHAVQKLFSFRPNFSVFYAGDWVGLESVTSACSQFHSGIIFAIQQKPISNQLAKLTKTHRTTMPCRTHTTSSANWLRLAASTWVSVLCLLIVAYDWQYIYVPSWLHYTWAHLFCMQTQSLDRRIRSANTALTITFWCLKQGKG